MRPLQRKIGTLLAVIQLAGAARAEGADPEAGAKLFRADCSICHSAEPGRNLVGPSLFNVINRRAGQIANFHYSDANRNSGITWNIPTLDQYLTSPRKLMPGTKMTFPGLPDAKQRADVIAYLETLH